MPSKRQIVFAFTKMLEKIHLSYFQFRIFFKYFCLSYAIFFSHCQTNHLKHIRTSEMKHRWLCMWIIMSSSNTLTGVPLHCQMLLNKNIWKFRCYWSHTHIQFRFVKGVMADFTGNFFFWNFIFVILFIKIKNCKLVSCAYGMKWNFK